MSGGWRTMDSAPKDGSFVMLFVPGADLPVTMGTYFREEDRDENGRFKKGSFLPADWDGWLATDWDAAPSWLDPTHWMPLPEPPEDSQ